MSQRGLRKRILFLTDGFRMGGAEINLLVLLKRLQETPFQVYIVNIGPAGAMAEQFFALNVPVYHWERSWMFDIKPYIQLYRMLRKLKIDTFQSLLPNSDIRGTLIAQMAGVKHKISWETVSHTNDYFHGRFDQKNGYRWAMKYVSKIVAVSNEVKFSLMVKRHIPEHKILTIHNAVDLKRYFRQSTDQIMETRKKLGIPKNVFVLGIVARLDTPKAHWILIDAVKEVIKKHPVYLLVVGEGPKYDALMQQVNDYGLSESVQFLGKRSDIPDLLNAMDAFCLSSIFEGLPNVIVEAMACELPVIASNIGGIPEAITHLENGYLVPAGHPDLLADAMIEIIENKNLRNKLKKNAVLTIQKHFSQEHQVKQFISLYHSL